MVLDHFIHNPNSHEKRCLIEFDGVPIGYIQMYPVDSEEKLYMAMKHHKMYGDGSIFWRTNLLGKRNWNKIC